MAFSPDFRTYSRAPGAAASAAIDQGLRAYMLRVFNWMTSGLLLTGIVAYGIAHTGAIDAFYPVVQTPMGMVRHASMLGVLAMLAPLEEPLGGYFNYFGAKGALLKQLGRAAEARRAFDQAISLAGTPAQAAHIRKHLDQLGRDADLQAAARR